MMTRKTNNGLVAYAKKALAEGWRYWYGTTGVPCTQDLLDRKKAQYPGHYGEGRMAQYRRDIAQERFCADCINLIKGYMWLDEKSGKQIYKSNNCPDTNANGMFNRASEKGDIASMPEVPGLIVRFNGHAGIYIGNGRVIEARGFKYGIVETAVDERPWTHWYKMPELDYEGVAMPAEYLPGNRILCRGMRGSDVSQAQNMLLALGYDLPKYGADGQYGAETELAVRAFQSDATLNVDGLCGFQTFAALTAQWEDIHPEDDGTQGESLMLSRTLCVRRGPGKTFEAFTTAEAGTALTRLRSDGWIPVLIDGMAGWIPAES